MSADAYRAAVMAAHGLRVGARELARAYDLDEVLREIDRAESIGAILDPTAWMRSGDAMREDAETIRAVRALAALGGPVDRGDDDA